MGLLPITAPGYQLEELRPDAGPELRAAAQELLLEYGRFVISQPGTARFCFGSLEKEAARLPESFIEAGGGCLIAHARGTAVGFVAWKNAPGRLSAEAWEIKRLWVRGEARGLGLGRALTQAVLDRAKAAGRRAVYLDTVPETMSAAYRIYLELGFATCEPYNDNPVEGIVYLVKYL